MGVRGNRDDSSDLSCYSLGSTGTFLIAEVTAAFSQSLFFTLLSCVAAGHLSVKPEEASVGPPTPKERWKRKDQPACAYRTTCLQCSGTNIRRAVISISDRSLGSRRREAIDFILSIPPSPIAVSSREERTKRRKIGSEGRGCSKIEKSKMKRCCEEQLQPQSIDKNNSKRKQVITQPGPQTPSQN